MTEQALSNERHEPGPTDDRRRWMALYVLCAGMLMIVLDVTVVNVALPNRFRPTSASRSRASRGWSTPT